MKTVAYSEVRSWMYRNARNLELRLWQYYFEHGTKEAVVDALMFYQNEDGGFGHALEADNWNPNSTPITTDHAIKILRKIHFEDMSHPIFQGIWRYLHSEKDLLSYGWRFTVPSNDEYPHAPWWNYSEEQNQKEYFGVTAELSAFILKYGSRESPLWEKARNLADTLLLLLSSDEAYGDMGLEGFITLVNTAKEICLPGYDYNILSEVLARKIKGAIEHDTEKWAFYTVRPSTFIRSAHSSFYPENTEIVKKELEYLVKTKPQNGVWGITWTWFENMERYQAYFNVSENWWKSLKAIENMEFLRNFGYVK